jgi:hypothetical protein
MTYGDLFKSGGGYYYTVVDHSMSDQGGIIDGSKTLDYPDCDSVPGHWVAPTPLPGQSVGAITGTTYNSSTEACNNYQSGFEGNLWLSGTSTPDVGLFFFTGQDCGTTFTGNSNWYYVFRGATQYAIRIGGTGYISEVVTCGGTPPSPSLTPTQTPTSTHPPIYDSLTMYSGTSETIACSMVNPVNVYYLGSLTTGTKLFTDNGITPVYGYYYSTGYYLYTGSGDIYQVVDSEGSVDFINTSGCPAPPSPSPSPIASGTGVIVQLSVDINDACNAFASMKYTTTGGIYNGLVLYDDISLTSPVTGYNYVLDTDNSGAVYNMNSSSGQIGSDTHQSC